MPTFADHVACRPYEHATDQRVRRNATAATLCQFQRAAHVNCTVLGSSRSCDLFEFL